MRLITGVCVLAAMASTAPAQVPIRQGSTPAGIASAGLAQTIDSLHLSRRQAIADALVHNAQLEAAREQTAEARARRVQDVAIPDPAFTADYATVPGPFGNTPSKPVGVGLDVPFPDKFRLNNRIGLADIRNSEQNYRLQQQTIALQASSTYDSLLVALRHRGILNDALGLANDFLKRTQARYNAGSAARLDVIQAQVGVAQAQNDLIGNERDVAAAQASLSRTLGRVGGLPIQPTDSLTMPASLPDSSTIEQRALEGRPELLALMQQQLGAAASTGLAKEFWLPDITFSVEKDYSVPEGGLVTAGIALPLPVFWWQHSKGDIAQAQHFERELAATYRDTRAQVAQDVRTSYATASTAMKQVAFLQDQLVPAASEAYRVASTSYSLGGSSALEVITARSALLTAEGQLADALANANTARADLERALGVTIPTPGASNP
jgi:cobalt-zinc-cadmium efflux system outer membrane protein